MNWLARLIRRNQEPQPAIDRETLDGWLRTGYEHQRRGKLAEAERVYREILDHDPRDPDALFFLGLIAMSASREAEALDLFQQAIQARPNDATFWSAFGAMCYHLRCLREAAAALRIGLTLQPESIDMRNNLAATLLLAERSEEAREVIEQVLATGRRLGDAYFNLGSIYRHYARIDEGIAASRKAVDLEPGSVDAFTNLLLALNYSPNHGAPEISAEHRRFGAQFARPCVAPRPDRSWPRRLRLGYVSADFRRHVVASFAEPILAAHDRERFEIFCYYNNRHVDEVTERFRRLSDQWLDCSVMSDAKLAERIRSDRIDILVDLTGHTNGNRLLVFAAKPAPLQLTYLGYPNTTGLVAVDYRISDARADPPGEADRLSVERLLRPWPTYFCYRPPADTPPVAALPATAKGHVTFGSFNNLPKVSAPFLDAAARILAAVPGSRLKIKSQPLEIPHVAERLRERFIEAGIDPARVEFRGWEPTVTSHLAAYGSIDIAIDTFPYNGATTTCEALWMGVPVVTVVGDRHAGRMGSSILNAVGLGELVAEDVDAYVATCATLANDLNRLAGLRSGLRERMRQSPLMDEAGFTRALERHYLEIWEKKIQPEAANPASNDAAIEDAVCRAAALRVAGKTAEAESAYQAILLDRPGQIEALSALGELSCDSGNYGAAVEWLTTAIAVDSSSSRLHYLMGRALLGRGNPADAAASFRQALVLDPRMARGHNNLGCALEGMNELEEARRCYQAAIALDPQLPDPVYNLGNVYGRLGERAKAIPSIRRALELDPGRADWRCNLGDLLRHELQFDQALESYRAALDIEPQYAVAHLGRGLTLQQLGCVEQAETDFRKIMELHPDNASIHSNWLSSLHYRSKEDVQARFEAHTSWAKRHASVIGRLAARAEHERQPSRRLNIGYVLADLGRHSLTSFVEPVLAAHDRSRFKIFAYSNVARPDEAIQRMRAHCGEWRDISALEDLSVAQQMRADRIDILVDLAGHATGGRILLFACKPAPVQVTWLGYPGTTGLATIDYRLTDSIADPDGETERFHTESLVRLPNGFLCYGAPAGLAEAGEPPSTAAGHVTFGSFNDLERISPSLVALWAQILKAIPDSRLIIQAFGLAAESARRALRERFAQHGIQPARLELCVPEEPFVRQLEKYRHIDIALDTFPYNAVATTCEALWMGVPVVTLTGSTFASRAGASILSRVGLADFAAKTTDEYVQKAVQLARDADRLRDLHAGMRERLLASPLLDASGFARDLERAYEKMWHRWCEDEERAESVLRLRVGSGQTIPGWKTLHGQPGPGVDYVGDCCDLGQFGDESVDELYLSHVLQRFDYVESLPRALREFHRVLKKGGTARISVPDFDILCRLFLDQDYTPEQRFHVMRMAFGGQTDIQDFHRVGLSYEILGKFLSDAGFAQLERVKEFGTFEDASLIRYAGVPISLNVVATK